MNKCPHKFVDSVLSSKQAHEMSVWREYMVKLNNSWINVKSFLN